MSIYIESRPKSDPARWARVHIQGDAAQPFERSETSDCPFWMPEWTVKKLLQQRRR
jgi:hypothetical protein